MTALALGIVLGQLVTQAPAGSTATLLLADRSEVRGRSGFDPIPAGIDIETVPQASLTFDERTAQYSITYAPRLTYFDVFGARDFTAMHNGHLAGSWSPTARFKFGVTVDGSIGTQNALGLALPVAVTPATQTDTPGGAPPPNGTGTPPTTTPGGTGTMGGQTPGDASALPTPVYQLPPGPIKSATLRTGAGASYGFSRRWTGNVSGGFALYSGLDDISKQLLPPSKTGSAGIAATYGVNARDSLTTSVSGTYTSVSVPPLVEGYIRRVGGHYYTVSAAETFEHVFSPRTRGALSAGVTYLQIPSVDGKSNSGRLDPNALATMQHTTPLSGGGAVTLYGGAALATYYNPLLGVVQPQAIGLAGVGYKKEKWTAQLNATAGTTVTSVGEDSARTVGGLASIGYAPEKFLGFELGARGNAQKLPAGVTSYYPPQWAVYFAVTVAASALRL